MRIQYASDLHLDLAINRAFLNGRPLQVAGDILLLGGDIGKLTESYITYPLWDWASENFRHTLIVPGNHEFYGNSQLEKMSDGYIFHLRENVRLCYNAFITIENIDFILTTLWGEVQPEFQYLTQKNVSDFDLIKCNGHSLTVKRFNKEHLNAMQFLKKAVAESKSSKRVVLTHHLPTEQCLSSEFKGSMINGAFVSENFDFIHDNHIDYWVYGHSHRNIPPIDINGTTLISNQLGYVQLNEETTFNPGAFFNL